MGTDETMMRDQYPSEDVSGILFAGRAHIDTAAEGDAWDASREEYEADKARRAALERATVEVGRVETLEQARASLGGVDYDEMPLDVIMSTLAIWLKPIGPDALACLDQMAARLNTEKRAHVAAQAELDETRGALDQQRRNAERADELLRNAVQTADTLRVEKETVERNLREMRRKVREEAIKAAKEENWCIDGLNAALERLGLEEYEPGWKITGTVKYEPREVSWTVRAATAEAAEERLLELLNEDTDHSAFESGFLIDSVDFSIEEV